ncbi:MAG: ATP-binding protein [Balneolaceae bacterium]
MIILSCFHHSLAQSVLNKDTPYHDHIIDQWTVEDGLPVNTINDILHSSDGYMWLATHDGLVRFDGLDFKLYTSNEYPELKSNRIHSLEEAADGSILIKTEGVHISRMKNDSISYLLSFDISISGNGLGSFFYEDDRGQVWLGGDDGIYIYREDSFQKMFPELVDFQVINIKHATESEIWFVSDQKAGLFRIKDNILEKILSRAPKSWEFGFSAFENEFWISSSHGLYRFSNERLDTMYTEYSLDLAGVWAHSSSEIYLADTFKGYIKIKDGEIVPLPYSYETPKEFSYSKLINGSVWNVTTNGVYRDSEPIFEDSTLNFISFQNDKEDNIWIGTKHNGLFRLRPKLFKTYSEEQGLPKKQVYSLFQSKDSSIWVGTFGGSIAKIKDETVEAGFTIKYNADTYEIDRGYIRSFAETEDGTLLVCSIGAGLQYLDQVTKTANDFGGNPELSSYTCYSLFYDSKGYLWAGFDPYVSKGLVRFKNGEWEQISGKENVPVTLVRYILETPSGELWFATLGHGLIRFDGTQYYQYDVSHGLSSNVVRGLHFTEDESGSVLWVGFEDTGLDRIPLIDGAPDFDSITNYQTKDGLFDNSVHTIFEDENERFWINSNRGIFRIDRSELNAFHRGKIETLYSHGYTEQDGLLNREGNGGVYPAGVQAFDGYIWFPTQDGVVSFHPDSIVANDFIPPVKIRDIRLTDREPILLENTITLNRDERDIEISYASLSFTDSEKNQYRYFLEGYDDKWRNVGTRRTAYYTNLPSGNYTFRVQGSNNEGIWNTEGASFKVIVTPHFYETPFFYILVLFFLVLVVISIVKLRNRYFRKREEILKHQVAIRTNQLQEEKAITESQAKKLKELDEAKSRFFTNITHELRTPLTLIMGPLEQLHNEKTETYSSQSEMMLRNSKRLLQLIDQLLDVTKLENKTVSVNPEPVLIKPYIRKCISLFSDAIERKEIGFTFTSSALSSEVYIDSEKIEKVLGNILGNALKFTPARGHITVSLDETNTAFLIKISDSGVGISKEELPNIFNRFYRAGRTMEEGFGIGLSITKELVELHKGIIEVESTPGEGTTFTISLLKGNAHFESDVEPFKIIKTDWEPEFSAQLLDEIPGAEEVIETEKEERNNVSMTLNHEEDKTTILVVDDNTDMRVYVRSILSKNYQVIEAKNGVEAMKIIEQTPPDLILADLMMPEMDGTVLNKKLKECAIGSSIPFVFLTAKTDKESRISELNEGADFYITKPFDTKELKAVIRNLLSARARLKKRILKELKIPEIINEEDKKTSDPFIQKLHEILEQEYSNHEFSLDILQNKLYMSRSSLYRTMNEKTGMNTLKYVTQFRLKKAYQMLLLDEGSISEVAFACGFKSLSYFGKVFKDHFKESPTQFLKSHSLKS